MSTGKFAGIRLLPRPRVPHLHGLRVIHDMRADMPERPMTLRHKPHLPPRRRVFDNSGPSAPHTREQSINTSLNRPTALMNQQRHTKQRHEDQQRTKREIREHLPVVFAHKSLRVRIRVVAVGRSGASRASHGAGCSAGSSRSERRNRSARRHERAQCHGTRRHTPRERATQQNPPGHVPPARFIHRRSITIPIARNPTARTIASASTK